MKKYIWSVLFILCAQTLIADPYTGKIKCKKLENALASMPYMEVGRFCQDALEGCALQPMLNKITPEHSLYPILAERLQDYINLGFEKCELAIYLHDPRFYKKNLERLPQDMPFPVQE